MEDGNGDSRMSSGREAGTDFADEVGGAALRRGDSRREGATESEDCRGTHFVKNLSPYALLGNACFDISSNLMVEIISPSFRTRPKTQEELNRYRSLMLHC